MATIGEHYRATGGVVPPGVYRVVGTGEPVVLLRVATEDGRRVNTGEIHEVEEKTFGETFQPAENPDAGLHPVRALRNATSGFYWQFRRFL